MKFVQNTGAQRNNFLLIAKNAFIFRRIKRRGSDFYRRKIGCKSCCPKSDSFLSKIRKGNLILVMLMLIKREKCLKHANKININNKDTIFIGYLKQHNEFVGAIESWLGFHFLGLVLFDYAGQQAESLGTVYYYLYKYRWFDNGCLNTGTKVACNFNFAFALNLNTRWKTL